MITLKGQGKRVEGIGIAQLKNGVIPKKKAGDLRSCLHK